MGVPHHLFIDAGLEQLPSSLWNRFGAQNRTGASRVVHVIGFKEEAVFGFCVRFNQALKRSLAA